MITRIRHTGIVVRDLENAVHFYEKLGFALWKREVESGPFLEEVVGIPAARIETAKSSVVGAPTACSPHIGCSITSLRRIRTKANTPRRAVIPNDLIQHHLPVFDVELT